MRVNHLFAFLGYSLLCAHSCKEPPEDHRFYALTVTNHSASAVVLFLAGPFAEFQYPDTALPSARPSLVEVEPGGSFDIHSSTPWAAQIVQMPADTMSLFVIDRSIYQATDWSIIRQQYLILKRYELTVQNMAQSNAYVNYPKEMKVT